jgi:hypothetical protein
MVFTALNEVRIAGGEAAERRAALRLLVAHEWGCEPPDEAEAQELEDGGLRIRFASLDSLPEEELRGLALDFPELLLELVYVSVDGEFLGSLSGKAGELREESLDFEEGEGASLEKKTEDELLAWARSKLPA